jgi:hypothetical protein
LNSLVTRSVNMDRKPSSGDSSAAVVLTCASPHAMRVKRNPPSLCRRIFIQKPLCSNTLALMPNTVAKVASRTALTTRTRPSAKRCGAPNLSRSMALSRLSCRDSRRSEPAICNRIWRARHAALALARDLEDILTAFPRSVNQLDGVRRKSAPGHKRKSGRLPTTSGPPLKPDVARDGQHVSNGPRTDTDGTVDRSLRIKPFVAATRGKADVCWSSLLTLTHR